MILYLPKGDEKLIKRILKIARDNINLSKEDRDRVLTILERMNTCQDRQKGCSKKMSPIVKAEIYNRVHVYVKSGHEWEITWYDVLSFLHGYYGGVTIEMIQIVREFQRAGTIK